jgi:Leucine-rich repeat (LRR) protein
MKNDSTLFYCPPRKLMRPCRCLRTDPEQDSVSLARLDCYEKDLNDSTAGAILNSYLSTRHATPLKYLDLQKNGLTRVPSQLKLFPHLETVYLYDNAIRTIRYGDFNFTATLNHLSLDSNQLTTIEPGSFQGIICTIVSINQRFNFILLNIH